MCSAFERLARAGSCVLFLAACADAERAPVAATDRDALTVCADPNNLPFSNRRGEGFENHIVELVGKELGLPVHYVWWPQRRGFARNTLNAGSCDLIAGVPAGYEMAATTRPYYASSYVFLTRADSGFQIRSFDDPRLRQLRIGIHAVGDDYGSVPPAVALASRGIVDNLHGFSIHGAYDEPDPPARLIEALAADQIDVAIAWGPLAGYFSQRSQVPLHIEPVPPSPGGEAVPMRFAISMAVRREDQRFLASIDAVLQRRSRDITRVLQEYGVPLAVADAPLVAGAAP